MKTYEVTLRAQVYERVIVAARDEDEAFEVAEAIVRSASLPAAHIEWDWHDIEEDTARDPE
jgi:hypothetical protein